MQSNKVAVTAVSLIFLVCVVPATSLTLGDVQEPKSRPNYKEWKRQKDKEEKAAAAEAAKDNSMSPEVKKVVEMLETLKDGVMKEGEKEAAWYNKFACFCKDTTAAKTASIKAYQDESAQIRATVFGDQAERERLAAQAETLGAEMSAADKAKADAIAGKNDAFKVYRFNEAQMIKAIESVTEAVTVVKSKRNHASFLQMQDSVKENLREALELAEALGFDAAKNAKDAIFLQESNGESAPTNEVNMENYKFKSEGIISLLEGLQNKFVREKREIDAKYAAESAAFDSTVREKTYYVAIKQQTLDTTQGNSAAEAEAIAAASAQLTIIEARLLDDQTYLAELVQTCSDKARTFNKRTQSRADELTALQAVVNVIGGIVHTKYKATIKVEEFIQGQTTMRRVRNLARNDEAMEALEESVEEESFLQLVEENSGRGKAKQALIASANAKAKQVPDDDDDDAPAPGQQKVADFLKAQGMALKSTVLLNLATRVAADPFKKIKVLITELIDRMLQEEQNESGQKSWCDKALQDATMKRDYAVTDIEALNSKMGSLEAKIEQLSEEIDGTGLPAEIKELKKQQRDADEMRRQEKEDNDETIKDAKIGLDGVKMAKDIIYKFYATAQNKAQKDMLAESRPAAAPAAAASFLQVEQSPVSRPTDSQTAVQKELGRMDAMEGGFSSGDHYSGNQGTSGGIIEMLDVIISDFKRTIKESEAADKQSEKEHLDMTTEIQKSLQVKETALSGYTDQRADANKDLFDSDQTLVQRNEILGNALSELMELQGACIDTGMTFEERAAAREKEIESLNRALCIFKNLKRGPDDQEEC